MYYHDIDTIKLAFDGFLHLRLIVNIYIEFIERDCKQKRFNGKQEQLKRAGSYIAPLHLEKLVYINLLIRDLLKSGRIIRCMSYIHFHGLL